jgi:pimeloyl-ACP methyl ester carboxylesterase
MTTFLPLPMRAARLPLFIAAALLAGLPIAAAAQAQPLGQLDWTRAKKAERLPNGLTLHYVEAGDPAGKPLLLLHGWTDTSRSWSLLLPQLSKYRLIIPDLRGHGGSDKPECCYAIGDFAHDIRLLLDAKGIERVSTSGHSLGSFIAQRLAFDHPERIERLVLIGSTASPAFMPGDPLWNEVMKLGDKIDPEAPFIREWVGGPTPIDPAFLAAVRPETAAVPRYVWRGVAREVVTTELARAAETITAPTMIVWGDKDPLFGAEMQAGLRAALPHAVFHAFQGLGHNTHWEAPQAIGELIADFIDSPAARSRVIQAE